MTKIILAVIAGILLVLVVRWGWQQVYSFRAQKIEAYADQTPVFDIREALNGDLVAEGVLYDFRGRVASRFTADLKGEWQGDKGTLTEAFTYSTGTTQNREWQLELGPEGRITGRAADIDGVAEGRQLGSAVTLRYRLILPESLGGHTITATDWMYLVDGGVVVNRAEFRKFGFKVGELIATFRPAP